RGIQTLYRVALRNHIKLSDIADTKANILLSVNAIIVSLVIANLIAKLNDPMNRFLIAPTLFFVALCIVSMILAIKVTQPSITRGEFTPEDLEKKRVNLAFFGNFHKMELEKYQKAFSSLIKNKEDVYSTLTKDLYFLGIVLDRKYRLLYYTYYAFIVGIVLSVLAFSIAFALRDSITL
ncbi:MAG TPA: Pycsar system effector family protein, partial [Flavobacteriaceae bacterium]|nr:Pycsar system effector family protein [Flavobacteriaceae bacterium]